MTDEAFSALESRLAPVLSVGGRGYVDRHDVLELLDAARALRAECRRLRQPPDASGLMPAAELERERAGVGDALLAHVDAQAALIRELYGVVADLHADDPGRQALLERGRAEGREQAARQVEEWVGANINPPVHPGIVPSIRALGPCRPPLPPHAAEAEAERLRQALRQCLERLEWASDGHGLSPAHFAHAVGAARKALAKGGAP